MGLGAAEGSAINTSTISAACWGEAVPGASSHDVSRYHGSGGQAATAQSTRQARFAARLDEARRISEASLGLPTRQPSFSARTGLTPGQKAGMWSGAGFLAVVFWLAPYDTLEVLGLVLSGLFSLLIILRLAAILLALVRPGTPPAPDGAIGLDSPPMQTLMVPLYREANVAAALVAALKRLDYPRDRLEVMLLVECDDHETIAALDAIDLPEGFEIIPVPPGEPRTKPRALNYGLALAQGDIIGIYDAEDRPAPDQLRAVAAAFANGPADLAVVQAPLDPHNPDAAWIARQFALEYAVHFRIWLPLVARLGAPMPLGGTSNFVRRDRLVAAGGWDAWNVTEDADLGVRLARAGGRAGMIAAPTEEEAPIRLSHWMAQRTRWMKGHVQTWMVFTRDPGRLARELGVLRAGFLLATFGGSLAAAIMHGPLLVWLALGLVLPAARMDGWHIALLGAGYGSVVAAALSTEVGRRSAFAIFTLPIYWPLLSLAMVLALFDLWRRPHFWSKTPHGVGRG
jgi:glycosyltransferase XagB